jgi:hypothetical protein
MAVLSTSALTLADIAKRLDPNGKPARIIELLSQRNDVLTDMVWVEGNLPTGMRTTVRTGLPAVAWRLLNQGVAPSKSVTAQMDEQCGMLEAYSEVDKDLAELNGNTAEYRLQEAKAFLEAMNQEFTQTLFYGNAGVAPEEFTGLAARYSTLNPNTPSSQNVLSGGGTGSDNSSIYLIVWSDSTVHGIYPKGSQAGLVHEDIGLTTVEVSTGVGGNRMRAYLDRWQWKCGIALRDWRYVVRIANIDISNLVSKTSAADLIELMIRALHRIPNLQAGRAAFYMNRTCYQMLDIQRRDDVISGGQLTYEMVDGKAIASFRGIPVRLVDQLLENEAVVA